METNLTTLDPLILIEHSRTQYIIIPRWPRSALALTSDSMRGLKVVDFSGLEHGRFWPRLKYVDYTSKSQG